MHPCRDLSRVDEEEEPCACPRCTPSAREMVATWNSIELSEIDLTLALGDVGQGEDKKDEDGPVGDTKGERKQAAAQRSVWRESVVL